VKAEKRRVAKERVKARETLEMFKRAKPGQDTGSGAQQPKVEAKGTEGYQSIFAPTNLEGQVGGSEPDQPAQEDVEAKGTEGYQSIFAPSNLEGQVESENKQE
jgi:hypothetical protein